MRTFTKHAKTTFYEVLTTSSVLELTLVSKHVSFSAKYTSRLAICPPCLMWKHAATCPEKSFRPASRNGWT